MSRLLRKSSIIIMWALSSSAVEENLQHHDEGIHISRNTNTAVEFTCQNELPRIKRNVGKTQCQKSCVSDSDCSGYHFDRRDGANICTLYSASDGVTRNCVKTAVTLQTIGKFSCARGDTTSFTDIQSINECETKCVQDDCYGFEYNSKERSCDVFMSLEDQSQWPTKSVRCDKKVTCPCFGDREVENAANELRRGTKAANLRETSCQVTSEGLYGLYYTNDIFLNYNERILNSFSVSVGNGNANQARTCMIDNTRVPVSEKQENICLAHLQSSCNYLNSNRVSLDGTCPCFTEDDLTTAVVSIKNKVRVLKPGSCIRGRGISMGFYYTPPNDTTIVEGYDVYSSKYSTKCTFGGDMKLNQISRQSAVHCSHLITEACRQI